MCKQCTSKANLKTNENLTSCSCYPWTYKTNSILPEEAKGYFHIAVNGSIDNGFYTNLGINLNNLPNDCFEYPGITPIVFQNSKSGMKIDYYIRYILDDNTVVFANKENGEVLEQSSIEYDYNQLLIVSNLYTGEENQKIVQVKDSEGQNYKIFTEGGERCLTAGCEPSDNTVSNAVSVLSGSPLALKFFDESFENISLPHLSEITTLKEPPKISSINDSGMFPDDAERAVKGTALIPCIAIKDDSMPLSRRMEESPYYALECNVYWHLLWAEIIPAESSISVEETLGINRHEQNDMEDILNMTVASDFGLTFYQKTNGFKEQISSSLNMRLSRVNDRLSMLERSYYMSNPQKSTAKYIKYAKAHEFVLKRTDGSIVDSWIAIDRRDSRMVIYPSEINQKQ